MLEEALKRERERTNAESWTTARVAQIVTIVGSQGKASAPVDSFLPYEQEERNGRPRLPASVASTLRALVKARQLPMPIIAFLMEDLKGADPMG